MFLILMMVQTVIGVNIPDSRLFNTCYI